MLDSLVKGVYAKARAHEALVTLVDSDIYYGRAPQWGDDGSAPKMPYVVFYTIVGSRDMTFCGSDLEGVTVQFSLYDDSSSVQTILQAISDVDDAFNRATITLDVGSWVGCQLESHTGPERLEEGVWRATLDYRMQFHRGG